MPDVAAHLGEAFGEISDESFGAAGAFFGVVGVEFGDREGRAAADPEARLSTLRP